MFLVEYVRNLKNSVREFGVSDGIRLSLTSVFVRKPKFGAKISLIKMRNLEHPVHLRMSDSDWSVFQKIFLQKEYDDPSIIHQREITKLYNRYVSSGDVPVIIDCGANIGLSAIWYARAFPKAIVIAIEPEPNNFALLEKNTCNYENVIAVNAGISNSQGRMEVFNSENKAWSFQVVESSEGKLELITIHDALNRVSRGKMLIVKIDIEGFEEKLFQSNTDWVASTPLIVAETHDWLFPWRGTAHAINSVIVRTGIWDQLQKGENVFYYSHKFLKS